MQKIKQKNIFPTNNSARYCDIDSSGNKALVMKQFLADEKVGNCDPEVWTVGLLAKNKMDISIRLFSRLPRQHQYWPEKH